MHLCEECLKTRDHLLHTKIIMKEVLPKINELNMIVKIIKAMHNLRGFENIKNLS